MTDLRLLKRHVQDALDTAVRNRNQFPQAAVNWADLSCRGVSECRTDGEAMPVIVVLIEEADLNRIGDPRKAIPPEILAFLERLAS